MVRATATVLFTDLVGSTELRGRLGEEAADELRCKHDQLLARAVEANNGRVVKGLGDGVMATFAGASDAVAAAVAIQQAVDRLNRSGKATVALQVRVGLSGGDVAFEDDDVHGTPVIEAARLCAAAGGGEILVSEVVRLVAGLAEHALADRGRLELKGLAKPVPAWTVHWEPGGASTVPMPALLTDVGRIFVGREADLERLQQLWKEAAAGERRVVLLAGEPGVGKTRLAAELAIRVHEEGIVVAGRCDEDLGVPFQPFVEALQHFLAHLPPTDLKERLGRHGGELARLVPEVATLVPGLPEPLRSDPETERYRLFDAVVGWLAQLATETPVLLVLDDLHWAAKPTLLLLRHVLRASEPMRLLVVVTYRDTDIGRGHPLKDFLADLRREGGAQRVSLTGLDRAGVAAFIEAAAGHALPDEEAEGFIRAVWEETEGNPFFVAEVIRHLTESGAIEQRDGRWVATMPVEELGIPEGVRDVVGRRLSRLPEGSDRVLGLAAVVGLEFETSVLAAAGGSGEEPIFSAVEAAVAARLLVEVSGGLRYRFSHALVRATLYEEISGARRVALHRRVAKAIESVHGACLDDHLPALAHHWFRAAGPAADVERAVDYATRAGNRALAQLAHDEAGAYYRQALELLDADGGPGDDARRQELMVSLGEVQRRAGDPAHRETLLAAVRLAERRRDADAMARAALANLRAVYMSSARGVDVERVGALEAALASLPSGDSDTRARLMAALALERFWDHDWRPRRRLSDDAVAMARRLGARATLAYALAARPLPIGSPDSLDERLGNTAELVELAKELGDPLLLCQARALRFRTLMESADVESAERELALVSAIADELGQPTLRWTASLAHVGCHILHGRFAIAEEQAEATLKLGLRSGQPDARLFSLLHELFIRLHQGRLPEAERAAAELVETVPSLPALRALLTLIHAGLDRHDDVRKAMASVTAAGFDLPFDTTWLMGMTAYAAASAALRDTRAAAALYPMLEPYGKQLVAPGWGLSTGAVAHALGLLATVLDRFTAAEAHFRAAEELHHRIDAPAWLAGTRLEWGRMLLARSGPRDLQRARELFGQAVATARQLGLAAVERRTVELLS